jgi:hypothetical protein
MENSNKIMELRITDSMEFHGKSNVRSVPFHLKIYSMELHSPYSMERNPMCKVRVCVLVRFSGFFGHQNPFSRRDTPLPMPQYEN